MKKSGANLACHILIYVRDISFVVVILWMVLESQFIQSYKHTRQLQDWIFTVFFCASFLSVAGLIIFWRFDRIKIKKDIVGRIITFCLVFITCYRFDLTMNDHSFGRKIYANQHVYLKRYSAWFREAEYYLYKTDGILFIKDGEPVTAAIWKVDEYIDFLKDEYG